MRLLISMRERLSGTQRACSAALWHTLLRWPRCGCHICKLVNPALPIKILNSLLYLAAAKMLDYELQFGVFLAHDLFELYGLHASILQLCKRAACKTPSLVYPRHLWCDVYRGLDGAVGQSLAALFFRRNRVMADCTLAH